MNGHPDPLLVQTPHDLSATPTSVRWRIVVLMMAYSFMTWFNRVSMSVAGDNSIMPEYGFSPTEMGFVYSAFLFVYALFMTPGGWFIDRFGARTALVVMGFGSALFGALTGIGPWLLGASLVLPSLLVIRALMGLCTAPIYPATGRTVSRWIPLPQRAWANGLIQGSAPFGIACSYTVFGGLIAWFHWPTAFLITGVLTGLLGLVWTVYATEYPEQHGAVNEAERQLIAGKRDVPVVPDTALVESAVLFTARTAPPRSEAQDWLLLLRNRSLVLLTVSYAAVGYFEYLFFFWMHYYFEEVLKLGKTKSELYASIPPLAMAFGMPLGGWISDRLQRSYGYRLGRALVPVAGMLLSAGLLCLGILTKDPEWIVTWFALALAAVGASEGPFWATAIELGGRRGGSAAGICNTGGNAGGIVAPILTPWVSSLIGWQAGISLGSFICLLGAGLWWWIDPCERNLEADEPPATSPGG
jgi:ACS family D-galactonate transporter-like MFS transporter